VYVIVTTVLATVTTVLATVTTVRVIVITVLVTATMPVRVIVIIKTWRYYGTS